MTGQTTPEGGKVSEVDTKMEDTDALDDMVRRASVPNLASLFKRGKESGLIKPSSEYGGTKTA